MAKLLLVEDDNNLREIYEARLTAEGYEITSAQNGEEALSIAKSTHPDLIISDVMMPRISGFEMLDILRNTEELKNTKVIMLTALGQAEDRGRADNLGADKYLVKSQVTLEDIVKAAQELLTGTPIVTPSSEPDFNSTPTPTASPDISAVNAQPVVQPAMPQPGANSEIEATPENIPQPVTPPPTVTVPFVQSVVQQPVMAAPEEPAASATSPSVVTPPTVASPTIPTPVVFEPIADSGIVGPATPTVSPSAAIQLDQTATDTPEATPQAIPTPVATALPPITVADTDPIEALQTPPVTLTSQVESPTTGFTTTPPAVADSVSNTTLSETGVQVPNQQSIAEEEAAIQAQISSFAAETEATPQPALQVSTPPADAASAANDALLEDAMAKLTGQITPEPVTTIPVAETPAASVTPVVQPAAAAQETSEVPKTSDDPLSISGRKVIQPLDDSSNTTPDIEALLAKEDAKDATLAEVNPTPIVISGALATEPQSPQSPNIDPNSIAL